MSGATGIQIGTANFINPFAPLEIIKGIEDFLIKENIKDISEIRGIV